MSPGELVAFLGLAERELFAGTIGKHSLWGLVAAAVTAAVGLVVGVRTISRGRYGEMHECTHRPAGNVHP
ncbi:hypothetical protein [Pseudarthrobacter sp. NamE2]|uniref:hypothetical protein n=1 Tax=Pseudarthrobacter sp. NamE2 TaxID=2576838 RepID=UPI001F0E5F9E|nr:hypothetical protein [Pseudarthrobacter sp. NamE2]